jgi:periplasmic divalent cation tolerance protein
MIVIYTTFPDWESAEKVVKALLEKRLIACANLREHKLYIGRKGRLRKIMR